MLQKHDAIQQFASARTALLRERELIQSQLQRINAVLGGIKPVGDATSPPSSLPKRRGRPPGRKPSSPLNMREAIAQVTARQPLALRDIVPAMQRIGYPFATSKPANSVGAFLYSKAGKKLFKRAGGKFQSK